MRRILMSPFFLFPIMALANEAPLGVFIGTHAAYLHAKDVGYESHNGDSIPVTQSNKLRDPAFGFSLGYRKRMGHLLIGMESTLDIANAKQHTYQKIISTGALDEQYLVYSKINKTISLMPQIGYGLSDGKTLAFLSSGYTMTHIKRSFGTTEPISEQRMRKWHKGWAFGLGVEHLIKNDLSIKAEFKHSTYTERALNASVVYCCDQTLEYQSFKQNQAAIGINYYFLQ